MKMFASKLSAFALVALVVLNGCKDDDDDSNSCKNGAFEMTFNNEEVTGDNFNNTLLKAGDGASATKRMDIRVNDSEGRELIITISDPSNGTSGNGISTDEYTPFDDIVSADEKTFFFTLTIDNVSSSYTDGILDITSCDASARQVSGTFAFGDDEYTVSGSFTDMCYWIMD
jgi:major membrane immunogen (membrane-anchored lipoprotein)